MGLLSKEAYQGKREYAAMRMLENSQIETLTPIQHDTLAWLCKVRHEIHISGDSWIIAEDPDNDFLWELVPEFYSGTPGLIEVKLMEAGLPMIGLPEFPAFNDYDIGNHTESDMVGYFERMGFDTVDLHYGLEEYAYYIIETVNNAIERYLSEIDEMHGTRYCPTGLTRMY